MPGIPPTTHFLLWQKPPGRLNGGNSPQTNARPNSPQKGVIRGPNSPPKLGPGTSIWGVLGCWLLGAKCFQWAMVRSWLKSWANLAQNKWSKMSKFQNCPNKF